MLAGTEPFAAIAIRTGLAVLFFAALLALPRLRPAEVLAGPDARKIGLSALTGMVVGMSLLMAALARGDVGIVSTLSSTTPILILPMVWVATGRRPGWPAWAGAALAVAGTALISLARIGNARGTAPAGFRHLPPLAVVRLFAVRGQVQALAFGVGIDAQAHGQVDQLEGHRRDHARPEDGDDHTLDLDPQLRRHGVVVALDPAQAAGREHPGQHRADDPADAVDAKDVQAVVIASSLPFTTVTKTVADRRRDRYPG
jgi:uncharacterized membrane protein